MNENHVDVILEIMRTEKQLNVDQFLNYQLSIQQMGKVKGGGDDGVAIIIIDDILD